MIDDISIIDFIKKKYNIYNLSEIIEIFLFGSLFGIVLYFFIYFKNDMMYYILIMGFITLLLMVLLKFKFKKEYIEKIEIINFKLKDLKKDLKEIIKN